MAVSMLADFAVRLAFGLDLALLLTSWRAVPPRFFRIQTQVILGVLVLAGLAQARARAGGPAWSVGLVVAGALLAYLATVSWGLGRPRLGMAAEMLAALATAAWMTAASQAQDVGAWAMGTAIRGASGFLMGTTLTAMLLGHYYLIAQSMTIEPLKRAVALIALGLAARGMLALIALSCDQAPRFGSQVGRLAADLPLLAARWGVGFAGAAVSVYLADRTVRIRSTQSATGILYVTTIFVLFGELAAMIDAGRGVLG
jgi:hypothetical protein